jgi:uncharacterized protein YacL
MNQEVFSKKRLDNWNQTKTEELKLRKSKMVQHKRIFIINLISTFIGSIGLFILMIGWFYESSMNNLQFVIIFEIIFVIVCFFVVSSTYKEYKRQKQMYETLYNRYYLRHEVKHALPLRERG